MTYSKTYRTTYAYYAARLFVDDLREAGFEDQACELEDNLGAFIYAPAHPSSDTVTYAIGGELSDPAGYWKAEVSPTYSRVYLFTPNVCRKKEIAASQIRESHNLGFCIPEAPAHYLCKLADREEDFMHTVDDKELHDLLCEVAESLGVIIFDM